MIDTETLRKVQNAGSIIAIQDGGGRIKIVLEDNVDLFITSDSTYGDGVSLRVVDTPAPEKKDDGDPLVMMSLTIWPGQNKEEFLDMLDAAVNRMRALAL